MERTPHEKTKSSLGSFITFALFVLLFRSLLFSPFRIPSGSMIPTLEVGDHIIASKFSYGWSRYSLFGGGYINYTTKSIDFSFPKRGDIIIFAYPNDVKLDFIKRVVGVPGDTIQMIEGRLHINGTQVPLEKVREGYKDHDGYNPIEGTIYMAEIPSSVPGQKPIKYKILKQVPFGRGHLDNTPPVTVPEDHVFCMGDNWDGSDDSRNLNKLGALHKKFFVGRALFTLISVDTEKITLWKPWTWLLIPFKIRFNRTLHKL